MSHRTLLVLDADRALRRRLSRALTEDGDVVIQLGSPLALETAMLTASPDLVILGDLARPDDQVQVLADLRSGTITGRPNATPVFVLSRDAELDALVRCFETGADDFRPSAIPEAELRARATAILRRATRQTLASVRRVGDLVIDPVGRRARWKGFRVDLSPTEFALLAHLASDPQRAWTRDELLREVWNFREPVRTRTVDATAARLRRKLTHAGAKGWIASIRGIGYRLTPDLD